MGIIRGTAGLRGERTAGPIMSYTIQYLQSELAAQGVEVSVLVNCLVQDAIRLGASDLHIEPWENAIAVRARVNGVLTEVAHLPLDLHGQDLDALQGHGQPRHLPGGPAPGRHGHRRPGAGRRATARVHLPHHARREDRRAPLRSRATGASTSPRSASRIRPCKGCCAC